MLNGKEREINSLIVGISQGNTDCLNKLYHAVAGHLLAVAKVYLYIKNKAEDVVSDVFLIVAKKAHTFNPSKNGFNWLYEITKNIAININRLDSRVAFDELEILDNTPSIEDVEYIDLLDDISIIGSAMKKLEPLERKIIYLKYWENKTVREIAKIINKPTMTTNDLIKRTIKKMKNDVYTRTNATGNCILNEGSLSAKKIGV